ncbi:MAG: glucoronyl hydrolase, partial [Spirochaetales bacterium]|nr:glucoronyl hydrolase [Spirochaetales bacterium]
DYSCHHTFFLDPVTGEGVRGETNQGHDSKSSWARGQAWAIYGLVLGYQKTGNRSLLDLFEPVSEYFLSRLPADLVPYWDLIFTEGDEPRDSSSSSIVACGFLAAAESFDELGEAEKAGMYRSLAKKLLKALYDHCRVLPGDDSNGLVYHGTYSKKSPYNTCTPEGVDECVSWGDYYWMEALTRLGGGWEPYW